MADPIAAGLLIAQPILKGFQGFQQNSEQEGAARYNQNVLTEQGNIASNTAAANEAQVTRRGADELGAQAAGFGEANIGTGAGVRNVERQSAGNVRLDALNVWYGGELERRQDLAEAASFRYQKQIAATNATQSLIGGGIGAGTKLLIAGSNYSKGLPLTTGLSGGSDEGL